MAALGAANAEVVSTDKRRVSTEVDTSFHLWILGCCSLLLILSLCISWATGDYYTLLWCAAIGLVVAAMSIVPAAVWHDRNNPEKRDAALILPWTAILAMLLKACILLSASLHLPLQDHRLAQMDGWFGIDVPQIVKWTAAHPDFQSLMQISYTSLTWLLLAAVFLPALTGKTKGAQGFLLANGIVILLAVPFILWLPSVGPWSDHSFSPDAGQLACATSLAHLRAGEDGLAQNAGVVCFPSFHVIWAFLSVSALWCFRVARIPLVGMAALIILSTMTTGWHYAADVVGGLLLASLSTILAQRLLR